MAFRLIVSLGCLFLILIISIIEIIIGIVYRNVVYQISWFNNLANSMINGAVIRSITTILLMIIRYRNYKGKFGSLLNYRIGFAAGLGLVLTFIFWEIGCGILVFSPTSPHQSSDVQQSGYCDNSLYTSARALLIINYIFWGFGLILICLCFCNQAKTPDDRSANVPSQNQRPTFIIATAYANKRLPPLQ